MDITLSLYFGNRGFFPAELIDGSRARVKKALDRLGIRYIEPQAEATRYGAVETAAEGRLYAEFLKRNAGRFDGVLVSLPNFGDENGAAAALAGCGTPIYIHAFPDEAGAMDFAHRRDAMCGKIAVMNVLRQCGVRYTSFGNFASAPESEDFACSMGDFARVCTAYRGMRTFSIGAIGARTTAFKTVRCDEAALQRAGVTVESIDLSEIFARARAVSKNDALKKAEAYTAFADFPFAEEKLAALGAAGKAIDDVIAEYALDAVGIRCWNEFETELKIAPCVILSELNARGVQAACELDVSNAVAMRLLYLTGGDTMLLDVNNNYGDDPDKAIMFHCSAIPPALFDGRPTVHEHKMFKKTYGEGTGVGAVKGELKGGPATAAGAKTEDGQISLYLMEGAFTADPIEPAFFGCGKVFHKEGLNEAVQTLAKNGYRHHAAFCLGHVGRAAEETAAYLGYGTVRL